MAALVGGRGLIHKGDSTTTGGVVTQGLDNVMLVGEGATQINMIATCPQCEKGWGNIVPIEKMDVFIVNVQAALHGDIVMCDCPQGTNTLISSSGAMRFSKVDGQVCGFKPHASEQEMMSTYQSVMDSVGGDLSSLVSPQMTGQQGAQKSKPEDANALRLKSPLLKQSLTLNKLANRESHSYRSGSHGKEVEYIQQALIKLGFDLGNAAADGDFGSITKRQVELFQKEYQATNNTHLAYQVGKVDGVVGQGTLLGLDEALVEGWVYHPTTRGNIVIKLIRKWQTAESTIGEYYIVGTSIKGYMLEEKGPDTTEVGIARRVPEGTYSLDWHNGRRFKGVLKLYNREVARSRAILIHKGNTARDTEGCLLPGRVRKKNFVGSSKAAFDELIDYVKEVGIQDAYIEITSEYEDD